MSVTKTFAVTLLVSTAAAFAPAFADETANSVLQVAAVEAHAPVNPATEVVPTVATTQDVARTSPVLSAEEARARLFGEAPVNEAPVARSTDPDAELIRDVAAMYKFQHYRPLRTPETEIAGSETFSPDNVPN